MELGIPVAIGASASRIATAAIRLAMSTLEMVGELMENTMGPITPMFLMAVAIGQLSLSLFFLRSHVFQELWSQSFSFFFGSWLIENSDEVKRRKREVLYQGFRKTLPMWIVSNDLTFFFVLAISAIGSFYPDGGLATKGIFIYGVCVVGLTLRYVLETGSEQTTTRDVVLIFAASFTASTLAPLKMQPLAMLARLAALEVVPEPGWFFRMQVAMIPVTIFFLWPAPRIVDMDFWCLLFNECVGVIAILMAYNRSDWTLSQQVAATILAEDRAEEAKSFCEAVRQLLSVTCDACTALSCDLQVSQPSVSLLNLLKVEANDIMHKRFIDLVPTNDQEHFESIVKFSSQTPSSGLVHLVHLSDQGEGHEVEVFQVKVFVVQLSDGAGSFLGISKAATEGQETGPPDGGRDMHFLLGNCSGKFIDMESIAASNEVGYEPRAAKLHETMGVSQSPLANEMEELKKISLVVDAISDDLGYVVKSASFEFADLPMEKQRRLPNLLEWLDHRWKDVVAKWLEEEVNLWFHGGQGHVLDVEFFPPSTSRAVLASLYVTQCEMHGEAVTCLIEIQQLRYQAGENHQWC